MESSPDTSPSKGKRVSFGGVTVIPIPRRGKFSLSLSTAEEETLDETPARNSLPLGGGLLGVLPSQFPLSQVDPASTLESSGPWTGAESLSESSMPCQASDSPNTFPGVHPDSQQAFTESQLSYLRLRCPAMPSPRAVIACSPSPSLDPLPPANDVVHRAEESLSPESGSSSEGRSSTQRLVSGLDDLFGFSPADGLGPGAVRETPRSFIVGDPHDDADAAQEGCSGSTGAASAARGGHRESTQDDYCLGSAPLGEEGEDSEAPPRVARRLETECPARDADDGEEGQSSDSGSQLTCVFCRGVVPTCGTDAELGGPLCTWPADASCAAAALPAGFMRQGKLVFHTACALFCQEVFCDAASGQLLHLGDALERSARIKCALCRKPGASVGCACADCQLSFHLPCALEGRKTLTIDQREFLLYCPRHRPQ